MAKKGLDRPNKRSNPLGGCLSNYTNESQAGFDLEFNSAIRTLRPDWFETQTDISRRNKEKLLQLAQNGSFKPSQKTVLGKLLANYIGKKSGCYDIKFDNQIRNARPDWFKNGMLPNGRANSSALKKEQLLKMAANGESRPSCKKSILGSALCEYLRKRRKAYDSDFERKIRSVRPDWFKK